MDREWLDGVYHMLQLILIVKCLIVLCDKVLFLHFRTYCMFWLSRLKIKWFTFEVYLSFWFYFLWLLLLLLFLITLKSAWADVQLQRYREWQVMHASKPACIVSKKHISLILFPIHSQLHLLYIIYKCSFFWSLSGVSSCLNIFPMCVRKCEWFNVQHYRQTDEK